MNRENRHRDSLEAEAACWVARRSEGLTATESSEFDRWCRAAPERAAAVARAEAAEDRLRGLAAFRADPAFRALLPHPAPSEGSPQSVRWFPWAIAASLAAILAMTQFSRTPPTRGTVFFTTEHGYQRLLLEGSVVQLNAQTELRVGPEGAVELERGEVSFTVQPGSREVRVAVGSLTVAAKAGAFSVRRERDTVALLVTAGEALLRKGDNPGRQVAAGEQLIAQSADLAKARIVGVRPEQSQELLAWQAPRVALADTRLADAIEQFNLYSWSQLELRDEALGDVRVSGVFRADMPDDFLRHLAAQHRIVSQRVRNPLSSDSSGPGAISILLRAAP